MYKLLLTIVAIGIFSPGFSQTKDRKATGVYGYHNPPENLFQVGLQYRYWFERRSWTVNFEVTEVTIGGYKDVTTTKDPELVAAWAKEGIRFPLRLKSEDFRVKVSGNLSRRGCSNVENNQFSIDLAGYNSSWTSVRPSKSMEECADKYNRENKNGDFYVDKSIVSQVKFSDLSLFMLVDKIKRIEEQVMRDRKQKAGQQAQSSANKLGVPIGGGNTQTQSATSGQSQTSTSGQRQASNTTGSQSSTVNRQTTGTTASGETSAAQPSKTAQQIAWEESQERARTENERRRTQEARNKELGNQLGSTLHQTFSGVKINDGGNTSFLSYGVSMGKDGLGGIGELSIGGRGYAWSVFHINFAASFLHGSLKYWRDKPHHVPHRNGVLGAGFQTGFGFGFREDLVGVRRRHPDKEVFTFGVNVFASGLVKISETSFPEYETEEQKEQKLHGIYGLRPYATMNISSSWAVTLGYSFGWNGWGEDDSERETGRRYLSPEKWNGTDGYGSSKNFFLGIAYQW